MERDELRLECLKLAAVRMPDHNEVLLRAEDYFRFVRKTEAQDDKSPTTPPKGAGVTAGKDRDRPG